MVHQGGRTSKLSHDLYNVMARLRTRRTLSRNPRALTQEELEALEQRRQEITNLMRQAAERRWQLLHTPSPASDGQPPAVREQQLTKQHGSPVPRRLGDSTGPAYKKRKAQMMYNDALYLVDCKACVGWKVGRSKDIDRPRSFGSVARFLPGLGFLENEVLARLHFACGRGNAVGESFYQDELNEFHFDRVVDEALGATSRRCRERMRDSCSV